VGEAVSVKSRLEEVVRLAHSPDHKALLELIEAVEAYMNVEPSDEGHALAVEHELAAALSRITEEVE
jgi:hypothetical protein